MGLADFHRVLPDMPVRRKEDVLQIVKRWEDGPYSDEPFDDEPEIDWVRLEQDIHALAHIAMKHLPD